MFITDKNDVLYVTKHARIVGPMQLNIDEHCVDFPWCCTHEIQGNVVKLRYTKEGRYEYSCCDAWDLLSSFEFSVNVL